MGSLPRPGPIGRGVRLLIGLWLIVLLYSLFAAGPSALLDRTAPTAWQFWLWVVLGFLITPYTINIGFSLNSKRLPQYVLLGTFAALIMIDLALYGTWWGPPLGAFVLAWFVYFFVHLGFSFVLSGILATPGCEMRAFPHLWTIVTGRRTMEHYCPGPIDRIDRWERRRSAG